MNLTTFRNARSYKSRVNCVSIFKRTYAGALKPSAIITMPSLSPSMEVGKVAVWKVKVGDKIKAGDSIADIETDKATLSFDTTDDGYLAKILIDVGVSVPIGGAIAALVDTPEEVPKFANYTYGSAIESPEPVSPTPSPPPTTTPTAPKSTPPTTTTAKTASSATGGSSSGRSSPYARSVAQELGVNLSNVKGTGPEGRIIAADVISASKVQPSASQTTATTPSALNVVGTPSESYIDIPNNNIKRITAERLTHSKQNIPHYYLTMECNADKLLELRTQLNDSAKGEYKLSVNDFIIKASANALKLHPIINSEWKGDFVRQYSNIDINVAVNSPKGLLVPMIKDVNALGLKGISNSVKEMAARAQEGKSTPLDLQMGTFSISNLGMFGISHFTAVINPPQAAILAVGNIEKKVELGPEGPRTANVITVTLSCDHRVIDGVAGAQWLQTFKDLIQNPIKLLL